MSLREIIVNDACECIQFFSIFACLICALTEEHLYSELQQDTMTAFNVTKTSMFYCAHKPIDTLTIDSD